MSVKTLGARVQELEAAQEDEDSKRPPDAEPKTFRDLYGVIKGSSDLTMEDFEAVKIQMNWDKFKDM